MGRNSNDVGAPLVCARKPGGHEILWQHCGSLIKKRFENPEGVAIVIEPLGRAGDPGGDTGAGILGKNGFFS